MGGETGIYPEVVDVFAEVDSVANPARPFGSRSYGGRATAILFTPSPPVISQVLRYSGRFDE